MQGTQLLGLTLVVYLFSHISCVKCSVLGIVQNILLPK